MNPRQRTRPVRPNSAARPAGPAPARSTTFVIVAGALLLLVVGVIVWRSHSAKRAVDAGETAHVPATVAPSTTTTAPAVSQAPVPAVKTPAPKAVETPPATAREALLKARALITPDDVTAYFAELKRLSKEFPQAPEFAELSQWSAAMPAHQAVIDWQKQLANPTPDPQNGGKPTMSGGLGAVAWPLLKSRELLDKPSPYRSELREWMPRAEYIAALPESTKALRAFVERPEISGLHRVKARHEGGGEEFYLAPEGAEIIENPKGGFDADVLVGDALKAQRLHFEKAEVVIHSHGGAAMYARAWLDRNSEHPQWPFDDSSDELMKGLFKDVNYSYVNCKVICLWLDVLAKEPAPLTFNIRAETRAKLAAACAEPVAYWSKTPDVRKKLDAIAKVMESVAPEFLAECERIHTLRHNGTFYPSGIIQKLFVTGVLERDEKNRYKVVPAGSTKPHDSFWILCMDKDGEPVFKWAAVGSLGARSGLQLHRWFAAEELHPGMPVFSIPYASPRPRITNGKPLYPEECRSPWPVNTGEVHKFYQR